MKPRTPLRVRMTVALLLLVVIDVLFVRAAIWFVTGFVLGLARLASGLPPNLAGADPPLWLLLALTALLVGVQYVYSRRRMSSVGGERTTDSDLTDLVTRRAQQLDVPAPTVNVAAYDRPNSAVYGANRSPRLVLSRELLETADEATLDAVVAHELAHVKNGDLWLTTTLNAFPILADDLRAWADERRDSVSAVDRVLDPGGAGIAVLVASALGLFARLFRAVGLMVARSFSQYREYAADAAAAELVGSPEQVAAALAALDGEWGPPIEDARAEAAALRPAGFLPHGFGELHEEAGLDYDVSPDWNVSDESSTIFGSRANAPGPQTDWDRIDDIERRDEDQPMQRVERRREGPDAEGWFRRRFVPETHPPTEDRIERLRRSRE